MKTTDIRLCRVTAETEHYAYRSPMKFGGRVVTDVTILNVTAEVETRSGRRATGFGSMTMGNAWAWPTPDFTNEQTLAWMVEMGRQAAAAANDYPDFGHPMEITHALAAMYPKIANAIQPAMPRLAWLVAASPLEAAIHDAYGKVHEASAFALLGEEFMNADLSHYLNADFSGEYLDRYTLAKPRAVMPLYHLIGGLDPLTEADIPKRLNDGLPETLAEWIMADGLTHLKIKLNGEDLQQDVARVVAIEEVVAETQLQRGCKQWFYSADFNEKCRDAEYVFQWLRMVEELSPHALECLQYIEQPTARDLRAHPENKMTEVAKVRPVVIDESLDSFESFQLGREMGYSGVALKACKGLSEAMLMGAAALKYGQFLCVQDLTCPGASFLLSATLASHIPTITAIEGNGRQYCPAANVTWAKKYPDIFTVTDGTIRTAVLDGDGVGF